MIPLIVFITWSVSFVLVAWAWALARRSTAARAKAEVYQEFADTFTRMGPICSSAKDRRRKESRRAYMNLALVDPLIRDGLRDALAAADEEWGQFQTRDGVG